MLDVGCGTGRLTGKLAARAGRVDAVDRDPAMVEATRAASPGGVRCWRADVLTDPLPVGGYDAVVSMSVLHHMPLTPALDLLAAALRPGGVLAVVALPRIDLPRDLPVELAATGWHHLIGVGLAAGGGRWGGRLRSDPADAPMPVRDPQLTTREVRRQAVTVLPGVRDVLGERFDGLDDRVTGPADGLASLDSFAREQLHDVRGEIRGPSDRQDQLFSRLSGALN